MKKSTPSSCYEKNFQALCAYFRAGIKTADIMKLGIEVEHFVFEDNSGAARLISYETGVCALLAAMLELLDSEASPLIIDQQLMGILAKSTATGRRTRRHLLGKLSDRETELYKGFCELKTQLSTNFTKNYENQDEECGELDFSLTLEPASQFEISLGPCQSASQAMLGLLDFYTLFILAARKLKRPLFLCCQGYNPLHNARELPLINKKRYQLMDRHFMQTGIHGIDMMRASASTQISLDYHSEKDCVESYRLASALGPFFAFIFDNADATHCAELTHARRMVRSHIWRGVDPIRCGLPQTLFEADFNFDAYAHWLENIPAILALDENHQTYDAHELTLKDLLHTEHLLSKTEIEHLLSMAFPNTRLKNFIEIRDVDSLEPLLVGAYAAWIRGIFYDSQAFSEAAQLIALDTLDIPTISAARTSLMQDGWRARIYGRDLHELACKLHDIALAGLKRIVQDRASDELGAHDISLLENMAPYLYAFVCPRELPGALKKLQGKHYAAQWRYDTCAQGGLEALRDSLQQELACSRAQKHGRLINWPFTPKFFSQNEDQHFAFIAETTHRIMEKASRYILEHDRLRKTFRLDEELEELCLLDRGYEQLIPLARIDIFYDEDSRDFKFCELNTDGSSGQIFMHETERLIRGTELYRQLNTLYGFSWHDTMSLWAKSLLEVYENYVHDAQKTPPCWPHIALVDWEESIMMTECDYFIELFEKHHGCEARFIDIRELRYSEGRLYDKKDPSWTVDLIWRRAVTSEMFEKMDEGARALIRACKDAAICVVGSFVTHIAGVKEFLPLLCSDEAAAFLSQEELEFMRRHSPQTFDLRELKQVQEFGNRPERWIIKAHDGYGGKGVYAGLDYADKPEAWQALLEEKIKEQGYIIQEYITPYKSYELDNTRHAPTRELFEAYDNLLGLYVFNGRYGGILQRIGKNSTITSDTGGFYQACFIVPEPASSHSDS